MLPRYAWEAPSKFGLINNVDPKDEVKLLSIAKHTNTTASGWAGVFRAAGRAAVFRVVSRGGCRRHDGGLGKPSAIPGQGSGQGERIMAPRHTSAPCCALDPAGQRRAPRCGWQRVRMRCLPPGPRPTNLDWSGGPSHSADVSQSKLATRAYASASGLSG